MTGFIVCAVVMVVAALAWLLPPLLRRTSPASAAASDRAQSNLHILRDQWAELEADRAEGRLDDAAYAAARDELQRRTLDEGGAPATPAAPVQQASRTAWVLAIALPLAAAALYLQLGGHAALTEADAPPDMASANTPQAVEALVTQLAERMRNRPDDVQGWMLLARSYGALQRYEDAERAYEHLERLRPDDPDVLADHAELLAVQSGNATGEPAKLVARALALQPDHLKALALAGSAAAEQRDWMTALRHWRRARALAQDGSEFAQALDSSVAEVTALMSRGAGAAGGAASAVASAKDGAPRAAAASSVAVASAVAGRVSVAPALAQRYAPDDTLFIVARAAEGPRMPLAVMRRRAADLPLSFTLDDSMAMTPAMKISDHPRVVISARISKSGVATPNSGDLVGDSAPVAPGTRNIVLQIDRVQR